MSLASLAAAACLAVSACSLPGSGDSDGGASVVPETTAGNSEASPPQSDGVFKVIGKDIVGPDGNLFLPIGANIGAPVQDSAGGEAWIFRLNGDDITTPESVAAIDEWGWNFLRVNAECSARPANDNNAAWGNEEMFTALDKVIDTYTSKGIVVMVDCHDFTPKGTGDETTPTIDDPQYVEIAEFWKAAADRYGDNSFVWFNHLNEFHLGGDPVSAWQSVVDDGYNMFKETGAQNLVVFDLPNQGQQLKIMTDPVFQDWSKTMCNVVWDWHSYGGIVPEGGDVRNPEQTAFEAEVNNVVAATVAAEIPVVVGEIGFDWDSERQYTNFNYPAERFGALAALKIAPQNGYGIAVWHANGASPTAMFFGLKNSDQETFAQPSPSENLSELGELFWTLSQEQKAATPQAGPTDESCSR